MPSLSSAALFTGQEDYVLDEKGRVTMPARWRQKGLENEPFHLVPDSKGACLRVMNPEVFAGFGEQARETPGMDPAGHRVFLRNFYANSLLVTADKQGRIVIPKNYCEKLRLSGTVRLLGCGDLIEIWNKESHETQVPQDRPQYVHIVGNLGL